MNQTLDIGGDGGNSFPFNTPGDQVSGQIISLEEVQQTDLQTGQPKFFESGQKMMMYQVTLQTQLRDPANPNDDGKRTVYLKGSRKPESKSSLSAVIAAVQAATGGTTNLTTGGTLTLQYVGNGETSQRGFNPPKLYQAAYQAPSVNLQAPPATGGPVGVQPGQPDPWAGAPGWAAPPVAQAPLQQPPAPVQQYAPPIAQQPAQQQPVPVQTGPDQAAQLAALQALGITPEQLLAAQQQQLQTTGG